MKLTGYHRCIGAVAGTSAMCRYHMDFDTSVASTFGHVEVERSSERNASPNDVGATVIVLIRGIANMATYTGRPALACSSNKTNKKLSVQQSKNRRTVERCVGDVGTKFQNWFNFK